MRIDQIRTVAIARGGARLEARVRYDDRPRRPEAAWFEVPAALADGLDATTGHAFLAAFLPLAHALGEPLEVDAPVDATLYAGAAGVPAVWHRWYGVRRDVELRAPRAAPSPTVAPIAGPAAGLRAAFFSGGADSTYTALAGAGRFDGAARWLDELLFVEGFDARLRDRPRLARARATAAASAAAIGLPLHVVRTNLRDTRWHEADWALVAHGALLAGLAHALGRRLRTAWIAASVSGGDDAPWGSHPATDERLSSATVAVRQHGYGVERIEKFRAIARVPGAFEFLRVCWVSRSGDNCGRCPKCVQARAMVDVLAGPKVARALPRAPDFLARLRAHPLEGGHDGRNLDAIVVEARRRRLDDLAAAAAHARGTAVVVPDRFAVRTPRSLERARWRSLLPF